MTFRKGLNRLEFSWANTLIDPTSVEFRALTHADEVEVLDAQLPAARGQHAGMAHQQRVRGEVQVEIRYFTSGISWAADYVAEATTNEKAMALAGYVRVNNNSGEDYENAQVRLVVGVIRLVEEIVALARKGLPAEAATLKQVDEMRQKLAPARRSLALGLEVADKKKEIVKEGLSEYFLYTVEGRDTIPNGWSKRLPSFTASPVPITSYYKYEKERWGDKVMRYYRFTNSDPKQARQRTVARWPGQGLPPDQR